MVGHEGEPASSVNPFTSEGREYFVGTVEDSEYVDSVFEDAKYFSGEEGQYRAAGIEVDITDEGIEYDITQEVDDEIVQEFVDGIVRGFEGANDDFRSDISEEISQTDPKVYTDGGQKMEDVDHRSYDDVQNVMDRGNEGEQDKVADGSGFDGIPIGGAPSYTDTESEEETDNMGDFPM